MFKGIFLFLFLGYSSALFAKEMKNINPNVSEINSIKNQQKNEVLQDFKEAPPQRDSKNLIGQDLVPDTSIKKVIKPRSNILRVRGEISSKKIRSIDTVNQKKATINPTLSPLFEAEWEYGFEDSWNSILGINFNWYQIYDDPSNTKVLSTEKSLLNVYVGAKYIWNEKTNTQFFLLRNDGVFYVGVNKNYIDLDTVSLWGIKVLQSVEFYSKDDVKIGADLSYSFMNSGKGSFYKVYTGNAYSVGIYHQSIISQMPVKFLANLNTINQNTEISEQQQTDIALSVQFQWGK